MRIEKNLRNSLEPYMTFALSHSVACSEFEWKFDIKYITIHETCSLLLSKFKSNDLYDGRNSQQ